MRGERDRNGEGKKQECQVVLYGTAQVQCKKGWESEETGMVGGRAG